MILFFSLISLFAASWAVVSVIMFRHDRSIFSLRPVFSFFGKYSSLRKYSSRPLTKRTWYHRLFNLYRPEKFPLSATALVMFTDGQHFFQHMAVVFAIAAAFAFPEVDYTFWEYCGMLLITNFAWAFVFVSFYDFILIKR